MSSYLLTSQALVALVQEDDPDYEAFRKWSASLTHQDQLFASEISLGEIRSSVEQMDPLDRDDWRHQLEVAIPQQFGANLLTFKGEAVRRWGLIRLTKEGTKPLPAEESQIIAQALIDDLILVGPPRAAYAHLGVKAFDPFGGTAWP